MQTNTGIWIDATQAIIVKISEKNVLTETILSNIQFKEVLENDSSKYGRFGGHYLTFEKNRKNKRNQQTTDFLKDVLTKVELSDAVVVFGPSKMKIKLEKEIEKSHLMTSKLKGVFSCDQLTENQIIAKTRDFFKK